MPLLMGRNWQLRELMAEWSKVYAAIDSILGNTMTQLPFGDPRYGQPTATTFTGRRKHSTGLAPTWTWSAAPSGWTTPFDLTLASSYQGIIPVLDFNGTTEEADTPDAAFWSRDDSAAEKFSFAAWVRPDAAADMAIISKFGAAGTREWLFNLASGVNPLFQLTDDSVGVTPYRGGTDIVANQWSFLCVTYDGTGGATAANGITHYKNGVAGTDAASNQASYVAMENLAHVVELGFSNAAQFFNGKIAGAAGGILYEQVAWTAEQVANLYLVTRGPMGV